MRLIRIIIIIGVALALHGVNSEAGWLVYHERELRGTILDIDTKQPIEGAVVVAVYNKATMGLGAGSTSSIIHVKEVLTGKDGNFVIPSYTMVIQPFSRQIPSRLIIFKPGYASVEISALYFTGEELMQEKTVSLWWSKQLKYRLQGRGLVELPRVTTREERLNALPSIPGPGVPSHELRELIELSNRERSLLGLAPEFWQ